MKLDPGPEAVRPPVLLGCFFGIAVVVAIVGLAFFAITFLESGANKGEVALEVAEAYAPGSAQFVSSENVFLVRLVDGSFIALLDLDAANRANQANRCRVNLLPITDPALGEPAEQLTRQMSALAAGSNSVLFESCLGSIYDIAGVRLNGAGPNLDRYSVRFDDSGHVVIDTTRRICTQRTETAQSVSVAC
ncbi:MAG: hypothetical protein AB7J35_05795 [Dehalococcoidia bacterium]